MRLGWLRLGLLSAALLGAAGCYHLGYERDRSIGRVIAVPIFENQTLRRHLEHDLTRHVRRELLESSSYHLAPTGPGVPELRGAILAVQEGVLIAGPAEEVLYGELRVQVSAGVYLDGRLVAGEDTDGDGVPDAEFSLSGLAERDTTRGEDRASASEEALRDVAEMLALRLQGRVDDRHEPNQEAAGAAPLGPGLQRALIQRDPDLYRIELPSRRALRVTLYHDDAGLSQRLVGEGQARARDEGRILELVGGEEAGSHVLEVRGPDEGARYALLVEVLDDDPFEPNQDAAQATPLVRGGSLRLLGRDDDWFVIERPRGGALEVELRGPFAAVACDAQGLPLRGVEGEELAGGGQRLQVPAGEGSVFVRVQGDGSARAYVIAAR